MKRNIFRSVIVLVLLAASHAVSAQSRRPIDSRHPLWLIHVDVWNKADPQKIIDLIPEEVKPYVCMNLSLSCQYDTQRNEYKMPQNAVRTYKSWASVCQANGLWFTCQPASGGHTHIQDDDLETFEYFYKRYPNFLGWNYAEQFWGFDEPNDRSSSTQASRIALFANLVMMAHRYGGFLTVSFCGNIWSHPLNPIGMMKRNRALQYACREYPEAILWLYKYTTSSCFYNNESVTWSPFVSGLAKNYGVRYDNCGWNGALDALLGENHGRKYPVAAGIGTVMEQTGVNGGAVWDGPELIWTEDFQNLGNTTVNGYTRRNWGTFPGFNSAWLDMFGKILDGTLYIPTREEVVEKTKVIVVNDISTGSDEQMYAAWGDLYDGLYKQTDPFNRGNGQWMDNFCYFKKTGRYGAIPVAMGLYDDAAKSIPVQVNKSSYTSRWPNQAAKVAEFNSLYPEVSTGDLYVARFKNQLITYTPYTYLNTKTTASAVVPLQYNSCESIELKWGKLSSGLVREYPDHIDFYLNNYRTDTTATVLDQIVVRGATAEPTFTITKRVQAVAGTSSTWDAETGTFTLNVRHMGPVDISINCTGSATDRLSDLLSSTPLHADLPKQPEEYRGEIIIEAEDMDYRSITSCVLDPYNWYPNVKGHAGNGFMDMGSNTAGSLRHNVSIKHPGEYKIAIRHTANTRTAVLTVSVNGQKQTLRCESTATNEWKKATFEATLKEGNNELTITNSGGVSMYIDNVTYTPVGTPAEMFKVTIRDAEHGSVIADVDSAAEGETVHLTVIPDDGYALSGWAVVHGGIVVADDATFTMPDDNVTLTPIFTDMSAVYVLDFTNVLNGTIPEGWRAMQENNELHQYPGSYSAGARTFAGFTGFQGKAFYWREQYAEYGRQSAFPLTLEPGNYKLTFTMAAWKSSPRFKAQILDGNDKVIAESVSYPSYPNANGSTSANLSTARTYELPFTIGTSGKYAIRFVNTSNTTNLDEYLLLECRINTEGLADGIEHTDSDATAAANALEIYTITGVKQSGLRPGINIIRTADGKTLKILRK